MENPGAIFYDQERIGTALAADAAGREDLTSLVAHETVHQWFGDAVTEEDWNHLWLSEGFAEYFDAVFFEFHGGMHGRGLEELARQMRIGRWMCESSRPPGRGRSTRREQAPGEYETLLNAENYEKAAWVLHMLFAGSWAMAFFDGVRDYYATLRDGTAWTADFVRVMEEASANRSTGTCPVDRATWDARAEVVGRRGRGPRRLRVEQSSPNPTASPSRSSFAPTARRSAGSSRWTAAASTSVRPRRPVEVVIDPDGWPSSGTIRRTGFPALPRP